MEPVQYLRALRQWWWVIVVTTLLGVGLAAFTMSSSSTTYQASETLLSPSGGQVEGIPSLAQMSVLSTAGDVPQRAAKELGVSVGEVVAGISSFQDDVAGSVTIEVEGSDETEVVARTEALAKALIASVDGTVAKSYDEKVAVAQAQVDELSARLAGLGLFDPARESLQASLTDAQTALNEVRGEGPPKTDLQILDRPTVTAEESTSQNQRILIAGVVGLIIGLGLALILSRFDTRIHSREAAEDAFGYPVIGEIPISPRSLRGGAGANALAKQDSPLAEAYRGLRSSLVFSSRATSRSGPGGGAASEAAPGDHAALDGSGSKRARVIMVMSAGMSEGKSTCVANLAATFAETGNRVLVISCDLRRPMIEKYLRVENDLGVSDVLAGEVGLDDVVVPTSTEGVSIVTSGTPISKPAELLAHADRLIDPARETFDVVIVDTPPVLATDDTSQIIPLVDDVVLLGRSGSTTEEAARRVGERLTRLGAPIAGVVLIGVHALPSVRGYYRSYVPQSSRLRVRPSHEDRPVVSDQPLAPVADAPVDLPEDAPELVASEDVPEDALDAPELTDDVIDAPTARADTPATE